MATSRPKLAPRAVGGRQRERNRLDAHLVDAIGPLHPRDRGEEPRPEIPDHLGYFGVAGFRDRHRHGGDVPQIGVDAVPQDGGAADAYPKAAAPDEVALAQRLRKTVVYGHLMVWLLGPSRAKLVGSGQVTVGAGIRYGQRDTLLVTKPRGRSWRQAYGRKLRRKRFR